MVAMRVGHDHMRHCLATYGVEQAGYVLLVLGAGVEDRDAAAPDDVAHGTLEGERARIIDQEAAHARHDLLDPPRRQIEAPIERDVVVHPREAPQAVRSSSDLCVLVVSKHL